MRHLFISSFKFLILLFLPLLLFFGIDYFSLSKRSSIIKPDKYYENYHEKQPDILLIGNSVTYTAFDENLIEENLKKSGYDLKVGKYSLDSTGPAMWYLILKNIIAESEHKPKLVVLCARRGFLASNGAGLTNMYQRRYFPLYSKFYEPVLEEKVFKDNSVTSSMDSLLFKISNIYYNREIIKNAIMKFSFNVALSSVEAFRTVTHVQEKWIKKELDGYETAYSSLSGLAGLLRQNYNSDKKAVGFIDAADKGRFDHVVMWSDIEDTPDESLISKTLVPEIIKICNDNNIKLFISRHYIRKVRHYDRFWNALTLYCDQNGSGIKFINLQDTPGIDTKKHFRDYSHFNEDGKAIISQYFSEQLIPELQPIFSSNNSNPE